MKNIADKKILTIFLGALALATVFLFSLHVLKTIYSVKTLPGLKIAGEEFSGIDKSTATWLLQTKVRALIKQKIKITFQEKTIYPSYEEAGVEIKIKKTISEAIGLGDENIYVFARKFYNSLRGRENISLKNEVNEETLHNYLLNSFSGTIEPVQNATLLLKRGEFVVQTEKAGRDVNLKTLSSKIKENIGFLKRPEVVISLEKIEPEVFQNEVDEARDRALSMSSVPFVLRFEKEEFMVSPIEIKNWISFNPVLKDNNMILGAEIDKEVVQEYLEKNIKEEINQEPENARFEKKDDKIAVFALPKTGQELDSGESAQRIKDALENNQNETELAVRISPPEITNIDTGNLVITDLLGEGASNFAGSPNNRRHNISVGMRKIHGLLVQVDETFSINSALGKVGPEAGYLPELVIKHDRTEPDFGGGLCQVSTTLFRAAVNSGLKITERSPHAYIVRYYGTPGMDATIYQPSPDLKFLNDSGNPILIQSEISGNYAYFRFYGVSDGRSIKTLGPYVYDRKPDGSAKARWVQEIYYGDSLSRRDVFLSAYAPPDKFPTPTSAAAKTAKIADLGQAGNNLFAAGKYADAKKSFEEILKLDPNHSGAKESLAIVQKKLAPTKVAGEETKKE